MKSIKFFALSLLILLQGAPAAADDFSIPLTAPLVNLDTNDRLIYKSYANRGEVDKINRVPDFSYAGYKGGGVAIPTAAVKTTLTPRDGDRTRDIQDAINAVSVLPLVNGLRGAVLLKKGFYRVDGTVNITASGVVLRGEGSSPTGTVILAGKKEPYTVINVRTPNAVPIIETSTQAPIRPGTYAAVGKRDLFFNGVRDFKVGDTILVTRTPNDKWIQDLGMDVLTTLPGGEDNYNWTPEAYVVGHERTITYINGGHIQVDIPFVDSINDKYGGGYIVRIDVTGRINNVGVEDIRFVSTYTTPSDENHANAAITFWGVTDSWARGVVAQNFINYTASAGNSTFITVEDSANIDPVSLVDGGRRYSFNVGPGGTGVLFQRVYADRSRHAFVTGAKVGGPHVWLDSLADNTYSDEGPHHRWATGLLFDNIKSETMNVQNRGTFGTGHGWAGAQVMLWRNHVDLFSLQAPLGAMSWSTGTIGDDWPGSFDYLPTIGNGMVSSAGPSQPRSLYLQQLKDRLGDNAVWTTTTAPQRAGRSWIISKLLIKSPPAGADPTCANGIKNGQTCCSASCGTCGGEGCSGRPGGADQCCAGTIADAGQSCLETGAPCNLSRLPARAFQTVKADPMCARGLIAGQTCCHADCGTCGGTGCGGRPGGGSACCVGTINAANESCANKEAPCVIPTGGI